ncbi:hypothetical protein KCV87_35235 [Actinosynnema pretiosum subsp. pretiosum]|uniref:Uncharacterized protein n=2 Tax=Actinosynnema TaxID=40566 RepID=C6WH56_ACTMD|nr:hypothetical protein [Actinosynnema mirum]ACU37975.1 hypothetical protein Amir_4120 [Actinosynnema mirum DSM 43827]AXX31470.1 hypothetical protein APASM_4105 [Actinosynnema pretiosum subsp. pretiosum]QUF04492.1 hypothetical protein KCV87_35235 [Actinosynnema pretiosum subsp. pretiosum]
MVDASLPSSRTRLTGAELNTRWHKPALYTFTAVVVAHWAEHLAQAFQIYVLGWPTPRAGGVLGLWFPWLVKSEVMHYGFALVMLVFLFALRKGFTGRSRKWWDLTLGLQFWHHFEHLLLIVQASTGAYLLGKPVPTSVIQLIVPRVELHLFYNFVVTVPMVVAVVKHMRPTPEERAGMSCSCAVPATSAA